MLRRTLKITQPPAPSRFCIVITEVEADKAGVRNEETRPERVVNTIALPGFTTQRYTQRYARSVAVALGARFMAAHRVKVVPAVTAGGDNAKAAA